MKTFKCDFGNGVACTIEVSDEPPAAGGTHIRRVDWQGSPSRRLFRPYVAWINSVNQQLADAWQATLVHVFLTGPSDTETWHYSPGGKPRLLADTPPETGGAVEQVLDFERKST